MDIREAAKAAKAASLKLAAVDSAKKNKALEEIASALSANKEAVIEANREDLERSEAENLSKPLLKRLKFDAGKINDVVQGIHSLIELEDPVGKTLMATQMDEGLELYRKSCPIGVIGVIFESRPDALVQIATLCLKSGNAVLLKGGREASMSNKILSEIIIRTSEGAGIPGGWMHLLETREDVRGMLGMDGKIDLIIPRGSNDFVRYIMDNSSIPVLGHADGVCHCYIDSHADLDMGVRVAVDSKVQYVAACNTIETLLVHEDVAAEFLPMIKKNMDKHNVKLLGCEETRKHIDVGAAAEEDWKTEYLDTILAVKVVRTLDEAVEHVNTYGSGHTDTIITENKERAEYFLNFVDSADVFWNCSTRFSDGFRFGFGAEVGISTNKLHARGPVGLEGLLTYKYLVLGTGQVVEDYARGIKAFTHKDIQ